MDENGQTQPPQKENGTPMTLPPPSDSITLAPAPQQPTVPAAEAGKHPLLPAALECVVSDTFSAASSAHRAALASGLRALLEKIAGRGDEGWSLDDSGVRFISAILGSALRRLLLPEDDDETTAAAGDGDDGGRIMLEHISSLLARTRLTPLLVTYGISFVTDKVGRYEYAMNHVSRLSSPFDPRLAANLHFPLVPCPTISLPDSPTETVSAILTSILEYLATELLEAVITMARPRHDRIICDSHLRAVCECDPELLPLTRDDLLAFPPLEITRDVVQWKELYLRTHAWYQARVKESAWYHQPDQVELVLQRYLVGELTPGHSHYYGRFSIRPVADGASFMPRLWPADRYNRIPRLDEMDRDYFFDSKNPSDGHHSAQTSAAFDLIDGAGREYPLVYEGKLENHLMRREQSVVCDRRTGIKIMAITGFDQIGINPSAGRMFARYVPHEFTQPNRFDSVFGSIADVFGNLRPNGDAGQRMDEIESEHLDFWTQCRVDADPTVAEDEARAAAKETYAEVGLLLCVASKLANRDDPERDVFSFTGLHPPKVIQLFTVAGLQAAFDSAEVRSAWSTRDANVGMPKELLAIIGEYAPVDLPSLSRPDGLAAAPRIGFSAEYPFQARSAPPFLEDQPRRSPSEPPPPAEQQ